MAITLHPSLYQPCGVWLREAVVEPHGLTVSEVAAHLGVSRQAISNLLNGRTGLSAEMAVRFEKAFGLSADTLCRMQAAYELAQVRLQAQPIDIAPLPRAA